MKKCLAVFIALILSIGLAVPVTAQTVTTGVDVTGGTTTPPIIKCKWEQDLTPSLEDGDPNHETSGAQFLPPLAFGATKVVQYWVVVTDPEGVSTVSQVSVDVYHPLGPPENGSKKYQVILTKVDKFTIGKPAYEAARDAGLVTYQSGYDDFEVTNELDKCTAEVYMGEEVLDYHQPAGGYHVVADACDNTNAWASQAVPPTSLENCFEYIAVPGMEIDFDAVNYGTVSVSSEKWIAGDTIFDSPVGAAPEPNPATVRNIGNTDIKITVDQNDMGFGFSGTTPTVYQGSAPPTAAQSNWNVVFDARLGSDPANAMYYDPNVEITLPNKLPLCNTEELDFSIHVKKSTAGNHTGTMTIGCTAVPFGP
jgi:hypothetical protein